MASPGEIKKAPTKGSKRSYIFLVIGIAAGAVLALIIINSQTQGLVLQRIVDESADDSPFSDPNFIKNYESMLRVGASYKSTMVVGQEGFFDAGAKGGTEPYKYEWRFDDGKILNGQNVTRSFDAAGRHPFILTVTDAKGKQEKADTMFVDVIISNESIPSNSSNNMTNDTAR